MKKFAIQIVILLAVIFAAIYFGFGNIANVAVNTNTTTGPQNTVTINGITIKVELADTIDKRRQGLGGRESLATDAGMLFIFPESKQQTFWMKGLKFPLDFIWIRGEKVVDITKGAQIPTPGTKDKDLPIYVPREPVDKVLEVNSGFANSKGIKIGDTVEVTK